MSTSTTATPTKIDKKVLLAAILFVGTLLYLIAVFWIGVGSIQHVSEINAAAQKAKLEPVADTAPGQPQNTETPKAPAPYPISNYITQALLVIGTALATHLGAYLGISINNQNGQLIKKDNLKVYLKSAEGISGLLAGVYFLTLVAAIIFWAFTGFSVYAGKPLQDLAYSFLGVFAGAMAALSKG